ncbi:MAG: GspE/PulE family protein [Candidatus Eremiobacteraeota bacterium]|nr:GspE/PulE family protein [Candidatus Eremiobacteraeota bacterium]
MDADSNERKSQFKDVPKVDLLTMDINREVAKILPEEICRKIEGICIGKPDGKTLVIAVKDPYHIYIYDEIQYVTGNKYKVLLLQGEPKLVDLAIEFIYRVPVQAQGSPWSEWLEKKKYEGEKLDVTSTGADKETVITDITGTIIEKANKIISEAISVGASDIHLETFEDQLTVRYRIDGVLHIMDVISDLAEARALIHRVKIMGNMDIAQDRITQGGRISVKVADQEFDLRVSIVPVPDGESIVLRLLNKGAFNLSLETLGFNEEQLETYKKMVSMPYGIILVSGPTGSGKSTTLYASLKEISRPDRKLITVEDPIEYQMSGVVQVQVNLAPREEEKKVTFGKALREFLRQDPDVILIGEIRDNETAEIAVKAAQTGHLVLSTIHTNDAVGIINRLKDMAVVPYLISSTLIGAIAQRLVRRLCIHCREKTTVPDYLRQYLTAEQIKDAEAYKAVGCPRCRRTGYKGRVGLFEILIISDEIRDLIERNSTTGEIYRLSRKQGMKTLLEDGVLKFLKGFTSMEEVNRVCMRDIASHEKE